MGLSSVARSSKASLAVRFLHVRDKVNNLAKAECPILVLIGDAKDTLDHRLYVVVQNPRSMVTYVHQIPRMTSTLALAS